MLDDARRAVERLLAENRRLRAQNLTLDAEVKRLSEGWEQVKRLARAAPSRRRR